MLAWFWPSGRWASRSIRRARGQRGSPAPSRRSAALATTLIERVTATLIGSNTRPRASTSALKSAMRSPICFDRRELVEQEIVAVGGDLLDRGRAAGAHPQRRMRLLRGGRLDDDVVELPVLAVMGPRRIRGPRLEHDLQRFLESRLGLLHGNAEAGELVVPVALADAEVEPAVGQQVERGGLLGQQHRVVPGQRHDGGAQAQRGGAGADPGQEIQRRGDLAEAGEVMLDDERAVEAEGFGLDVVLDEVPEAGPAVHVGATASCLGAAEDSKAHGADSAREGGDRVKPDPAPRLDKPAGRGAGWARPSETVRSQPRVTREGEEI